MDKHIFDRSGRVSVKELENVHIKRWMPPTIGKGGHLVFAEPREDPPRKQEAPRAFTPEEMTDIESIKQSAREEAQAQARQEGFEAGRQEGLVQGRTEGFEQGFSEGRTEGLAAAQKEATIQLKTQMEELNTLLSNITFAMNEQDYQLEQALLNMVQEIARAVVGRELQADSGHIMKTVREALAVLPASHDNVKIIVNPKDLALLEQAIAAGGENWRAASSEEVGPGGCRIQTDQSVVDFTTETRFRSMMEQIVSRQLSSSMDDSAADAAVAIEEPFEAAPEPVIKPLPVGELT